VVSIVTLLGRVGPRDSRHVMSIVTRSGLARPALFAREATYTAVWGGSAVHWTRYTFLEYILIKDIYFVLCINLKARKEKVDFVFYNGLSLNRRIIPVKGEISDFVLQKEY
jgi:hypothetical protein